MHICMELHKNVFLRKWDLSLSTTNPLLGTLVEKSNHGTFVIFMKSSISGSNNNEIKWSCRFQKTIRKIYVRGDKIWG